VASVTWFAEEIESRTNGRIKLDIQYNGVLCSQGTEFEALESGICDIAVASLSSNANRWPSLGWVIVPGMVNDYLQQAACLNAVLDAGYVDADMEANNVKVLWWQGAECFNYALTNKRVETVSDLAGLKIGYAGGEYIANTLNATGATATGINAADFYMSLSTGVIDGFVNPARYMYDAQFYEVVKYMPIGITCGASNNSVYMNADAFNSLPDDLQTIFLEVCAEAGQHFLNNAGELYSDEYELLTASGCECYELSEEVVNEYLEICAGLSDDWVNAQVAAGNTNAAAIRDLVLETAANVE
jgi:TRAP-type C4-dicarboxylate transport system substrate-binding protein